MRPLYAFVANKYTLNFRKIDSFRACTQSFVSCRFLATAFGVATGKRWSCKEEQFGIYSTRQKWPGVTLKHDRLL